MRKYRRLIRYPLREWPRFATIGALTVASSFTVVVQPWPLQLLVDSAFGSAPLPQPVQALFGWLNLSATPSTLILAAAVASVAVYFLASFFDVVLTRCWAVAGQRMVHALATDMFAHLQRLPLAFHQRHPVGDALSRLTTDSWCLYKLTDGILIAPAQKLVTLLMVGTVAWNLHAELATYAFVTAPVMGAATFFFGKRIKQRTHRGREAQSRLLSFVHQTLSVIPVVQAFGTEERNSERYQNLADDAVAVSKRGALLTSLYGLATGLITITGTALIIYIGGREVLMQKLSLGSFLVFIAYLRTLQSKAESLIKLYSNLKPVEASIERVLAILDAPVDGNPVAVQPPRPQTARLVPTDGHVCFDNVTFGYIPGRPVLREVTLTAAPGEIIAIVGASGSGKSTLVSLLPRLFDPWSGSVRIGDMDVREMPLGRARGQVAMLLQEPFLFPLSVEENIAYGRPGASRDEVEAVAHIANADAFIRRMPEGYNTVLAERGADLSGGERQRLAIARALLKDAPILILDEPTSALDASTEALVLDALDRLMAGRTTFIIAHRLSTIRRADRIVVLKAGRVAECGSHDELIELRGAYYQLAQQKRAPRKEPVGR